MLFIYLYLEFKKTFSIQCIGEAVAEWSRHCTLDPDDPGSSPDTDIVFQFGHIDLPLPRPIGDGR